MTTTGNVQFNRTTLAPTGERTIGDNSRFAPVTRQDLENLLNPHGFATRTIPGTSELVFCRTIRNAAGREVELRVYSGCSPDGTPRPRGQDAIRTHVWTIQRTESDPPPVRLRGAKRTMRVFTWRKNLEAKLKSLCDYARTLPALPVKQADARTTAGQPTVTKAANPKCPRCGAPTTDPKLGRRGRFHGCTNYPKCRGAVNIGE